MGRRDYRHRESKKTKKDNRSISTSAILSPPVTVEIVRKRKKKQKSEEEE